MSDKPEEGSARPPEAGSGSSHHNSGPDWWSLAKHIVIGLFIFVLVGGAAWVLGLLVHAFEKNGLDPKMGYCLEKLEFGIFLADIGLFLRFIVVACIHSWQAMSAVGYPAGDSTQLYFEPLSRVKVRIGEFFKGRSPRTLFQYTVITFLGFGIGVALLYGFKWASNLPPADPPPLLSPTEAPPTSDLSGQSDSRAIPRRPRPLVPPAQTPGPLPRAQTPEPSSESQEVTPPASPGKPIRIPSNVAPSKSPPVTAQERPLESLEPTGSSPATQERASPMQHPELGPKTPEEAQISVGGDFINVFPPTGPTLVTKATFGELLRGFEGRLTGMRLVALVRVDEIGHASVVGHVEFPANFPNSPAVRGRLSSQVKTFVERSVWRAARSDNGIQIAKDINLVVILDTKP